MMVEQELLIHVVDIFGEDWSECPVDYDWAVKSNKLIVNIKDFLDKFGLRKQLEELGNK